MYSLELFFADYQTNRISSLNGSFWELHNPDLKVEKKTRATKRAFKPGFYWNGGSCFLYNSLLSIRIWNSLKFIFPSPSRSASAIMACTSCSFMGSPRLFMVVESSSWVVLSQIVKFYQKPNTKYTRKLNMHRILNSEYIRFLTEYKF